jgi:hypothetical protein
LTRKYAEPDDLAWRSTGREREARRALDLRGHPAHWSVKPDEPSEGRVRVW